MIGECRRNFAIDTRTIFEILKHKNINNPVPEDAEQRILQAY
jgi:hypothetical protein